MNLRTIAILRSYDPTRAADLAEQCWAIGMDLVEVPVQDAAGWQSLEAVSKQADGRPYGAGTILSGDDVDRATDLGATVIISPDIKPEVVESSRRRQVLPLPGVMTPTDVGVAAALGLTACKLFPASVTGTSWLGALKGPFPGMSFIAVGGVSHANAADFIRAGASGVALGSSIEALLALDDPAAVVKQLHGLIEHLR